MGQQTNIPWVDSTFNPWIGCTKVSPGCANCYAEKSLPARFRNIKWGPGEERVRTSADNWETLKRWDRMNKKSGTRSTILCASLCDVFEDNPQVEEWREELFRLAEQTPNLDLLFLTKRPENVEWMLPDRWSQRGVLLNNVWFGFTIESQKMLDIRWSAISSFTHRFRQRAIFLSLEPLLGPIDFCTASLWTRTIDWVIVGGESGPDARPMDLDWARSIIVQCREAKIPVFFKQAGSAYAREHGLKDRKGADLKELPLGLHFREFPE